MVTSRLRGTEGTIRLRVLFTMLVLAFAAYYAVGPIGHYLDFAAMKDEMKAAARLGPSLEDGAIRRRLVQKAEALGLPPEARNFRIVRTRSPREIRISTSWVVTLDFSPFFVRQQRFKYEARASLLQNPLGFAPPGREWAQSVGLRMGKLVKEEGFLNEIISAAAGGSSAYHVAG